MKKIFGAPCICNLTVKLVQEIWILVTIYLTVDSFMWSVWSRSLYSLQLLHEIPFLCQYIYALMGCKCTVCLNLGINYLVAYVNFMRK